MLIALAVKAFRRSRFPFGTRVITPSPGTPEEGWGEGVFEQRVPSVTRITLTPKLSRNTGRGGDEGSASFPLKMRFDHVGRDSSRHAFSRNTGRGGDEGSASFPLKMRFDHVGRDSSRHAFSRNTGRGGDEGSASFPLKMRFDHVGRDSSRHAFCKAADDGGMNPALQETDPQIQMECTTSDQAHPRPRRRANVDRRVLSIIALLTILLASRCTLADPPTQEEVFKSIQDNVGSSTDSRKFTLYLCVTGGVIILLCLFSQRRKREISPVPLNHHGKLIKEIMKGVPVRPREIKQLKLVAEQTPVPGGDSVHNPLTMLLCPSLLSKAVQNPRSKADRRVLQQVLRKTVMINPAAQAAPGASRRPAPPTANARRAVQGRVSSGPRR